MPPQLHSLSQSGVRVLQGDLAALSPALREFIESSATLCQPQALHICDGSEDESTAILAHLEQQGMIKRLPKYQNWYVTHTPPHKHTASSMWL